MGKNPARQPVRWLRAALPVAIFGFLIGGSLWLQRASLGAQKGLAARTNRHHATRSHYEKGRRMYQQEAAANPATRPVSLRQGTLDNDIQVANCSAGLGPSNITLGDLNGDGKLDIAATNETSGDVSVLLGNGDGTFGPPLSYPTGDPVSGGPFPEFVVIADFNGDGNPDLAVANEHAWHVSVFLNNGDGTFQSPVNYDTPISGPTSIVVRDDRGRPLDFNGDGIQDMGVANTGNTVVVWLGNGDGTFQLGDNFQSAGFHPELHDAGDLNGDGKPDMAVADFGTFGPGGEVLGSSVLVFLGNGDGTLRDGGSFPAGIGPVGVAIGDYNGDGRSDLAVANERSGDVSILLGNGDGTFQAAGQYPAGIFPAGIVTGDLNGDGKLDLVVPVTLSDAVALLLGNGDGTFQPAVLYQTNIDTWPGSAAIGDVNGDSMPDLAVTNYNSSDIGVFLGNGDGTFRAINCAGDPSPPEVLESQVRRDADLTAAGFVINRGPLSLILVVGFLTFLFGARWPKRPEKLIS